MNENYLSLLKHEKARRLLVAIAVGWLATSMIILALVLAVERASGSFASAGFAVGAFLLASAAVAPVRGRLVDRRGARRVLPPLVAGYTLSLLVLTALCERGAPSWSLVLLSGLSGLMMPPFLAAARSMWSAMVAKGDLRRAYALTSILGDVSYIGGPALVGLIAVISTTAGLLVCTTLAAVAGSLLVLVAPARESGRPDGRRQRSLLASPRLRVLLVVSVALGFVMGTLEVAVPASAAHWHARGWAGVLLGAFSAGSLVSGLWFGRRKSRRSPEESYFIAVSLLGVFLLLPALVGSPFALGLVLVLVGLGYGPSTISLFEALDLIAPDNGTEALSWVTTAEMTGAAGGSITAGIVVTQIAPRAAFPIAAVALFVPAICGLVVIRRFRSRELVANETVALE